MKSIKRLLTKKRHFQERIHSLVLTLVSAAPSNFRRLLIISDLKWPIFEKIAFSSCQSIFMFPTPVPKIFFANFVLAVGFLRHHGSPNFF